MAPIPIAASLDIIAVGLLSKGAKTFGSLEIVGAINHLNIPEIACFVLEDEGLKMKSEDGVKMKVKPRVRERVS